MRVERIDIKNIKPHPKNPRIHPESEIRKLGESIKEFGWTNPILLSKDGYILAGHGRVKAAKRVGIREVPVIRLNLEGAEAEAYMLADNRIQEDTQWDMEILKELMEELEEKDTDLLLMTGFEEEEIDGLLKVFDEQFTRPEPKDMLEGLEIEEIEKDATVKVNKVESPDKSRVENIETWEEKKGAYATGNWLCVEFYGQDVRFNMIKKELEKEGAMITEHEIDSRFFIL